MPSNKAAVPPPSMAPTGPPRRAPKRDQEAMLLALVTALERRGFISWTWTWIAPGDAAVVCSVLLVFGVGSV